jgi:hypothetical protein
LNSGSDKNSANDDEYAWVPGRFRYLINNPVARLKLREEFYKKYGGIRGRRCKLLDFIIRIFTKNEGTGISEIHFLSWEVRRKVLNPSDHHEGSGSSWWRNVNLKFIVTAQIASEIHEGKNEDDHEVNNEISLWLEYLKNPSPRSWYRAHNASIVRAYLDFMHYAHHETIYEQTFINEVLYRVLFAQAMVEEDTIFQKIGEIAANPMLPSVNLMVHIPAFYPVHYPLNHDDIKFVMHQGHGAGGDIERAFDEYLIYPHIPELYQELAKLINIPQLVHLQKEGKPIYPHINL